MARYHHQVSVHHQKRFKKRSKRIAIIIVVILLVGLAIIFIDAWWQQRQESDKNTLPTSSTYRPETKQFDTPYFSFTTDGSWLFMEAESDVQVFTYRSMRGTLVEQELVVYINADIPYDAQVTRVLPIAVEHNNKLAPETISSHCESSLPDNTARRLVETTMEGIRFQCQVDGTKYIVVVGDRNTGNDFMRLERSDGSTALYSMLYTNSTANPDPSKLPAIINTFQAR